MLDAYAHAACAAADFTKGFTDQQEIKTTTPCGCSTTSASSPAMQTAVSARRTPFAAKEVAKLMALLRESAEPQAQNASARSDVSTSWAAKYCLLR